MSRNELEVRRDSLDELTVRDFGIIEEITWRPGPGLNVITGETGAGKSIVVDAVEALLLGQAKPDDIRHGSEGANVEAVFHLSGEDAGLPLCERLADKGLACAADGLLLTCDFPRRGRTTPRINRQAVPRSLLREVGAALVDIHGQSQHLSLLNEEFHLDFLDAYAHSRDARREFAASATELHRIENEIENLARSEQALARQAELLGFQVEEIKRAKLIAGEDEALEKELTKLAGAEKLKAASYEVYRAVYGDESAGASISAVDRLGQALPMLRQMTETDPALKVQLAMLEEALSGLEELAREVLAYGEELSYDPRRIEEVQERLELIRGLKRKYGGSIESVLAYLEKASQDLAGLASSGERREQLAAERERLRREMGALAEKLSDKRQKAAKKLAAAVKKELADLGMARVDFTVSISRMTSPEGIPLPDGATYHYRSSGIDEVVFVASTNPGEPAKPLDKIASTGEISRFMLALKTALAGADAVPILIFDEIDIGVGGRSGEVIGRKLWKLSRSHQVVCVTHLPQIAAFADAHFSVTKRTAGARTTSSIAALEGEARLNELAVMIGGMKYTEASLNAAKEMVKAAEEWKRSSNLKSQILKP
jgi:DNA repair protein RecN (Recombination protein N)